MSRAALGAAQSRFHHLNGLLRALHTNIMDAGVIKIKMVWIDHVLSNVTISEF